MRIVALVLALAAVACGDDTTAADADLGCDITGAPTLDIGVPDSITFLNFEPLTDGGSIPLSSNGQTFLAVQLAVKASNLERNVFIELEATYQPAMGDPRVAVKDATQLERLFCRSDDNLYLIPVVVSSEMLGDDLEIQDQSVDVFIRITDSADNVVSATANGVLTRI
jgi:hypothetical protein